MVYFIVLFHCRLFFPSLYLSVIVMSQIQKCCVKHQHNEECKDVVTLEKRIQVYAITLVRLFLSMMSCVPALSRNTLIKPRSWHYQHVPIIA